MSNRYDSSVKIGDVELKDLKLDTANRKKNAAILAAGYTPMKRRFEIATMTTFLAMECIVGYTAISTSFSVGHLWIIPLAFFVAEIITDFVSGIAHWMCDTWGKLDTPVVGPTFIRSFREHHVDPMAMCNHDFIESNSDACLFSVALNFYLLLWRGFNPDLKWDLFVYYFALFGGVFAAFTNEFHKWSHLHNPPRWITFLQSIWLVLPRRHHGVHHKPPFDKYYCITTGHLNYFLDSISFWRHAENLITNTTGFRPREDDQLWTGQIYGKKTEDKTTTSTTTTAATTTTPMKEK